MTVGKVNALAKFTPAVQQAIISAIVAAIFAIFASRLSFELTSKLAFIPGLSVSGPATGSLILHGVVVFGVTYLVLYLLGVGEPSA